MRRLDYVPSWLDDAHTLLEKLNKCIAKIEDLEISDTQSFNEIRTLLNEVKTTSENALSLAQTNESDISINDGEITVLQGQVSNLSQDNARSLKLPFSTPTTEEVVTILPNGTQGSKPLSEIGGGGELYALYVSLESGLFANTYANFVVYSKYKVDTNSTQRVLTTPEMIQMFGEVSAKISVGVSRDDGSIPEYNAFYETATIQIETTGVSFAPRVIVWWGKDKSEDTLNSLYKVTPVKIL